MERNGKGSFVHQYYKPTEIICGRQMKEWLPFSVSWWHNLGSQSMKGQFKHTSGILYEAEKAELAFEMMKRLDIEYFCLQGSGGCGPAENLLQTEEQQKRFGTDRVGGGHFSVIRRIFTIPSIGENKCGYSFAAQWNWNYVLGRKRRLSMHGRYESSAGIG